ncbi:alanine--tRNA ligase [Aerococcus urinaehominis]|uniref:Alanine--tRNA ligase n=1 Tax=Aerococcus urinaehominis TaxID=128944 RepID=A0A109RGS1_9LACT|nr:alanine--tRNA ligase [Aerococcus urinaehominis]AMB99760.1 alanine--tRNA ligase [Aerococcus urinaehominis]SDM10016.1 alanyl-tRNA synthetase [Aerococcus urinaehominis]
MKKLSANDVRHMWLDFWQDKGHSVEPSASLIPVDDPSLLWINSGVATLKPYFEGVKTPENPRITNVQKSIRTNDIENVGVTARHHTLFEMMGNFSIGDYFKDEAITWAWELLTGADYFAFEPEKLYMTYYPEDTATLEKWREVTGMSDDHFIALADNFWDLGAGPCGPCTEIFYDRGPAYQDLSDDDPEMYPGGENERYLEIWNIVFSQFNHMPDGQYVPLKQKNIDTGMGLERMVSVIQDTPTNFETDLFMPIIEKIASMTDHQYGENPAFDTSFKVIADHVRAVSFAIADRALPSNEGRGYILRRLIRRAIMHGRRLGINRAFLTELVPVVAEMMADFYPQIKQDQDFIQNVIGNEEARFMETIEEGESLLQGQIADLKADNQTQLAGSQAFKLYDTYGFPLELTQEYLEEAGMTVDLAGFDQEMKAQQERARQARKQDSGMAVQNDVLSTIDAPSEFTGYHNLSDQGQVVAMVVDGQQTDQAQADQVAYVITSKTPCYAEMGGQIGDTGELQSPAGELLGRIVDTRQAPNGQHLHEVELVEGLQLNQEVKLVVDKKRRHAIMRNHTATHLLHKALKDILGKHANQAGSLVAPNHLRFDFSHFGQVTDQELKDMERLVNEKIAAALPVATIETTIDKAKEMGAMALFGEKYGHEVRVVNIDGWSIELCGGTHVANTAEIGLFKILSESGIGAGIRRIEAVTSLAALDVYSQQENILTGLASHFKVKHFNEIMPRVEKQAQDHQQVVQELNKLRDQANANEAKNLFNEVQEIAGLRVITGHLANHAMNDLRQMSDVWKQQDVSDVLVLAGDADGKASLLVALKPAAQDRGFKAGDLIKQVAPAIGGGGGGRPDMAQAGGKNPAGIPDALNQVKEILAK